MIYDLEERLEKFDVKVTIDDDGEIVLSVTYDGHSWRTIHLLKSEATQVADKLMEALVVWSFIYKNDQPS